MVSDQDIHYFLAFDASVPSDDMTSDFSPFLSRLYTTEYRYFLKHYRIHS